jgi:prevent-host-death family protein
VAVVKIHEAKTNLSKLIARAEAGEDIVIARDNEPVVRLTAMEPRARGSGFAEEAAPYDAGLAQRITSNPEVCGGRPCIRGMRIRVSDVLGMLASGMTKNAMLKDYPYLEGADIDAALAYAAGATGHRVVRSRTAPK